MCKLSVFKCQWSWHDALTGKHRAEVSCRSSCLQCCSPSCSYVVVNSNTQMMQGSNNACTVVASHLIPTHSAIHAGLAGASQVDKSLEPTQELVVVQAQLLSQHDQEQRLMSKMVAKAEDLVAQCVQAQSNSSCSRDKLAQHQFAGGKTPAFAGTPHVRFSALASCFRLCMCMLYALAAPNSATTASNGVLVA
jgi:hypothetical protein